MPLAAVESPRLYRQIADQLRHLIERREFPVGGRLPPERELAEKLGVSRPSVREALIALEVEGRVRIRMGSGVYVTEPSRAAPAAFAANEDAPDSPYEVLGARALVESAVCCEAAELATGADIAGLDDILARMDKAGLPSEELVALDRAFHVAIAGILGNALLTRLVGTLFDQRINPYFQRLASHFENAASWRAALDEHRAIRDALAAASGPEARAAMRRHLDRSRERFFESFGEGFPTGQESVSACPASKN